MASLYKKPVIVTDPRTGERIKTKSRKWWGRFRDENGREKRVPLASDKPAAQAMLNEYVRQAERRAAGLEDPFEKHRKRQLAEHLDDFTAYLRHKDRSAMYVMNTHQRIRDILEGCKFQAIDSISASRVQQFLAELRDNGRSIASSNHYLRAIKMFTRWLVRDRRTNDDRLAHLSKLNEEIDRRRVRRPLSMDEFERLLQAAEVGPKVQGVSGPDRAVIYVVGVYTGYRRGEIGSVTRKSFDFDSEPPTLTVAAGYSKHRRTDVLPLRQDFADRIRDWLVDHPVKTSDKPLFEIATRRTALMVKKDLAAARKQWLEEAVDAKDRKRREASSFLKYVDDNGHYADFHSLRKTFITNLSRVGVKPRTAQTLARHSNINLTMNTYTMLGMLDQVAAVEALPPVPESKPRLRLATGT